MTRLKEGDKVPSIESLDHKGNPFNIESYKGKKIILYFYPKDNTSGCTAEACNLRDNYELLLEKAFVIFGISPDSVKSHEKFIEKYQLPFDFIMDEDKKIMESFGVWAEKKMYGRTYMGVKRTTFIISEDGIIEKIITKVKTKDHAAQILSEMGLN